MTTAGERPPIDALIRRFIFDPVPHHRALGLELVRCEPGDVVVRLPYVPELVGDPSTGVLAGGAVSSLLDTTGGCAAFSALRRPMRVATLDLRIDYMRSARPGRDVFAHAQCIRVSRSVAFVRGTAHDGDPDDPVATCAATFAIFESHKPRPKPPVTEPTS